MEGLAGWLELVATQSRVLLYAAPRSWLFLRLSRYDFSIAGTSVLACPELMGLSVLDSSWSLVA